jgi:ubiquitin conjugation factor E4 B
LVDSGKPSSNKRPTTAVDAQLSEALPAKKVHRVTEENLEDWSNRVLGDVFLITLDETKKIDSRGTKVTYLPELRAELEQSREPVKLTTSSIDAALLEAAKHVPSDKALLDYLLPCWKRVMRATRASRRPSPAKEAVLQEAKRLCMSNCIFALTMPEYFGYGPTSHLVPYCYFSY